MPEPPYILTDAERDAIAALGADPREASPAARRDAGLVLYRELLIGPGLTVVVPGAVAAVVIEGALAPATLLRAGFGTPTPTERETLMAITREASPTSRCADVVRTVRAAFPNTTLLEDEPWSSTVFVPPDGEHGGWAVVVHGRGGEWGNGGAHTVEPDRLLQALLRAGLARALPRLLPLPVR